MVYASRKESLFFLLTDLTEPKKRRRTAPVNEEKDIESLLEILPERILDSEQQALKILREMWETAGRPTEPLRLIAVLRRTLDRCERRGYSYPKVLLLRKGELTRGDFRPGLGMDDLEHSHIPKQIPKEWVEAATRKSHEEFVLKVKRSAEARKKKVGAG
jgi:hypothetical protein